MRPSGRAADQMRAVTLDATKLTGVHALNALLLALEHRRKTGQGVLVEDVHGDAAGDVAAGVAAHAVGHREEPPLRALQEGVLVPGADPPLIGDACEFETHPVSCARWPVRGNLGGWRHTACPSSRTRIP